MKNINSHFNFDKQQRSGILFLLILLVLLQLGYFGLQHYGSYSNDTAFKLDVENQRKFDSLVMAGNTSEKVLHRPFNPNFISDFKGYTLGMSPIEIDRLHQFRGKGKFVNSADEFQRVTGVSDSLVDAISQHFKFPEWVGQKKKNAPSKNANKLNSYSDQVDSDRYIEIKDLNTATAEELKKINGIGEKLSTRIIKFRDRLGGFLVNEQLYDVYGLESDVVKRTLKRFQVIQPPEVKKININTADVNELASLIYIRYNVAKNIVIYREENGPYTSLNDLFNVFEFPVNKIDRIGLYLSY